MKQRGHMKPKREKWAKHHVHCACGDALQEALVALDRIRCIAALLRHRTVSQEDYDDIVIIAEAVAGKYADIPRGGAIYSRRSLSRPVEKGGAPNTQTSLNPVNKGRRDSRKPKHTTSGTTNLAGPQVSMAPEPRRAVSDPKGRVRWSHTRTTAASIKGDGNVRGCCVTGQPEPAPIVEGLGSVRSETRECLPSAEMPTGAIPISHAWLDNRCARCGHEHEGPCPFCECAEHVEPVDPYEVEVERALEDAARNPSL